MTIANPTRDEFAALLEESFGGNDVFEGAVVDPCWDVHRVPAYRSTPSDSERSLSAYLIHRTEGLPTRCSKTRRKSDLFEVTLV